MFQLCSSFSLIILSSSFKCKKNSNNLLNANSTRNAHTVDFFLHFHHLGTLFFLIIFILQSVFHKQEADTVNKNKQNRLEISSYIQWRINLASAMLPSAAFGRLESRKSSSKLSEQIKIYCLKFHSR